MRIRRFSGATMADALRQVKATLGADAVILETSAEAEQVIVSAATDEDAPVRTRPPGPPQTRAGGLDAELRELLRVVRALVGERGCREGDREVPELAHLHAALLAQGVDGVIAAVLVRETADRLERGMSLETALASVLPTAPSAGPAARVRLFMGPPGDGKTSTVAKLAAQAREAGRRVALVTTDTVRVGGAAELATYGRVLGVPVQVAADPTALARALAAAAGAEQVLVDTAGAGPGADVELRELAALAEVVGPGAGRTLVTSGAAGSAAALRTWEAFAPLRPDACVLTKLDAAPGGPVLGVMWRAGLPVSHVAAGRRIPDDLEPATPGRLVRALLAA